MTARATNRPPFRPHAPRALPRCHAPAGSFVPSALAKEVTLLPQDPNARQNQPASDPAISLCKEWEKILKNLQQLHAESPKDSLRQSIEEVKAMMAKLEKPKPPKDGTAGG
jgi:hypothetical protein